MEAKLLLESNLQSLLQSSHMPNMRLSEFHIVVNQVACESAKQITFTEKISLDSHLGID